MSRGEGVRRLRGWREIDWHAQMRRRSAPFIARKVAEM
jgi:hypothetical protein